MLKIVKKHLIKETISDNIAASDKEKRLNMDEFASFLKGIRLNSGYTQTQFAAKLGIDTAALSKIENGKKEFDSKRLEVLSKEFDIKLEELKLRYFGEKIALELYENKCPVKIFKIAEEKYHCFEANV